MNFHHARIGVAFSAAGVACQEDPSVRCAPCNGELDHGLRLLKRAGRVIRLFASGCSSRGTRVSYDAVHYQWARLCSTAGLVDASGAPRYTPHQLRHTRGSELIAQGQRIEIV